MGFIGSETSLSTSKLGQESLLFLSGVHFRKLGVGWELVVLLGHEAAEGSTGREEEENGDDQLEV